MSLTQFRITAGTDVGNVRTNNEDNFIINEDLTRPDWFIPQDTSVVLNLSDDGCVLAVADGMGGLNAGEVASAIAVEQIKQQFLDADLKKISSSEKNIKNFMFDIVTCADAAIKQKVKDDSSTAGMGTTIIFVWIIEDRAFLTWCGDSRGYIFNKETGLRRISNDHSFVQELVDAGKLDADLAFEHPNSNIVTRCLGDFSEKARPEFRSYTLQKGDYLLLCSDGLCGICRDEEIAQTMFEHSYDIEQCKQHLIKSALNAGGYDNVTIALFEVVDIINDNTGNVNGEFSRKTLDCNYKSENKKMMYKVYAAIILLILVILALILLL